MFSAKKRVAAYLEASIEEMDLLDKIASTISKPEDFGFDISGMTVFRACGMSIQYVTENFVKIRNLTTEAFFSKYRKVPWKSVFGMRNFLVHEYSDVDEEAVFNTVKTDFPVLRDTALEILSDLNSGKLDSFFKK